MRSTCVRLVTGNSPLLSDRQQVRDQRSSWRVEVGVDLALAGEDPAAAGAEGGVFDQLDVLEARPLHAQARQQLHPASAAATGGWRCARRRLWTTSFIASARFAASTSRVDHPCRLVTRRAMAMASLHHFLQSRRPPDRRGWSSVQSRRRVKRRERRASAAAAVLPAPRAARLRALPRPLGQPLLVPLGQALGRGRLPSAAPPPPAPPPAAAPPAAGRAAASPRLPPRCPPSRTARRTAGALAALIRPMEVE